MRSPESKTPVVVFPSRVSVVRVRNQVEGGKARPERGRRGRSLVAPQGARSVLEETLVAPLDSEAISTREAHESIAVLAQFLCKPSRPPSRNDPKMRGRCTRIHRERRSKVGVDHCPGEDFPFPATSYSARERETGKTVPSRPLRRPAPRAKRGPDDGDGIPSANECPWPSSRRRAAGGGVPALLAGAPDASDERGSDLLS